jgi:hypothetical protein
MALQDEDQELHAPGGLHAASGRSLASSSSGGGGGTRGAIYRGAGGMGTARKGGGGEAVDIGSLDDRGRDGQDETMDFQTIDWTYYNEKDRERRMDVNYGSRRGAISRALLSVYDAMQGWLALSTIGFLSGVHARNCLHLPLHSPSPPFRARRQTGRQAGRQAGRQTKRQTES